MILCIESATSVCSVSLIDDERVIAFRESTDGFIHAEKLTVYVSEIFEEVKLSLKNLDAVAVSSGPGSYTGLRIGVSVAKGLCFAAGIPLISVQTLEAMTAGAIQKKKYPDSLYCPMIDARRMEVYCALYDSELKCIVPTNAAIITEDFLSEFSKTKRIFFFGDGADKCMEILKEPFQLLTNVYPSSKYMAAIATQKLIRKDFEDLALFEPDYHKEYRGGQP